MIEYFADRIKSADEEYRYRLDFKIQAETDEKKFQALQAYKNFILRFLYMQKNMKKKLLVFYVNYLNKWII